MQPGGRARRLSGSRRGQDALVGLGTPWPNWSMAMAGWHAQDTLGPHPRCGIGRHPGQRHGCAPAALTNHPGRSKAVRGEISIPASGSPWEGGRTAPHGVPCSWFRLPLEHGRRRSAVWCDLTSKRRTSTRLRGTDHQANLATLARLMDRPEVQPTYSKRPRRLAMHER